MSYAYIDVMSDPRPWSNDRLIITKARIQSYLDKGYYFVTATDGNKVKECTDPNSCRRKQYTEAAQPHYDLDARLYHLYPPSEPGKLSTTSPIELLVSAEGFNGGWRPWAPIDSVGSIAQSCSEPEYQSKCIFDCNDKLYLSSGTEISVGGTTAFPVSNLHSRYGSSDIHQGVRLRTVHSKTS